MANSSKVFSVAVLNLWMRSIDNMSLPTDRSFIQHIRFLAKNYNNLASLNKRSSSCAGGDREAKREREGGRGRQREEKRYMAHIAFNSSGQILLIIYFNNHQLCEINFEHPIGPVTRTNPTIVLLYILCSMYYKKSTV